MECLDAMFLFLERFVVMTCGASVCFRVFSSAQELFFYICSSTEKHVCSYAQQVLLRMLNLEIGVGHVDNYVIFVREHNQLFLFSPL
jgi:hypothetical protein